MAKKTQVEEWDQPAVVEDDAVEQPASVELMLVMVEALMPMWAETDVVLPETRYRLPQATAEYLAGMGFVAILPEEAG